MNSTRLFFTRLVHYAMCILIFLILLAVLFFTHPRHTH